MHPDATVLGLLTSVPYARNVLNKAMARALESPDDAAEYMSKEVNHMSYDQLSAFSIVASGAACGLYVQLIRQSKEDGD